jgi:hypothetical protein
VKGPKRLSEDKLGCICLAETIERKGVKHIDISIISVLGKEIHVIFIKTEDQVADIMAKGLSKTCFERFSEEFNVCCFMPSQVVLEVIM